MISLVLFLVSITRQGKPIIDYFLYRSFTWRTNYKDVPALHCIVRSTVFNTVVVQAAVD